MKFDIGGADIYAPENSRYVIPRFITPRYSDLIPSTTDTESWSSYPDGGDFTAGMGGWQLASASSGGGTSKLVISGGRLTWQNTSVGAGYSAFYVLRTIPALDKTKGWASAISAFIGNQTGQGPIIGLIGEVNATAGGGAGGAVADLGVQALSSPSNYNTRGGIYLGAQQSSGTWWGGGPDLGTVAGSCTVSATTRLCVGRWGGVASGAGQALGAPDGGKLYYGFYTQAANTVAGCAATSVGQFSITYKT